MQNLFSSYNSPFYEFAVKLNIKPIDYDDLYRYIGERFLNSGIVVLPQVINDILTLSGGHPHFTQYFASEAFYLILSGIDQKDKSFTLQWLTKIIESQSHIFQNMFDQLSNNQRKVLVAVAELKDGDELFSLKYREQFYLPVSSSVTSILKSMVKKDLMIKNNKKYEFINPVFREWLKALQ